MASKLKKDTYYIGQIGDFVLYDSFYRPFGQIHGRIVKIMYGNESLYAMVETENGIRPARLAKSAKIVVNG